MVNDILASQDQITVGSFIDNALFKYDGNTTTSYYNVSNTSSKDDGEDDALCEICDGTMGFPIYIAAAQLFLAVFMLTSNLLTMVAIYRCQTMTPSIRMSLLNLSVTDIAASLAFGYHVVLSWFGSDEFGLECIIRYIVFVSLIILTQVTVAFVSIDRILSIAMTYRYQKFATPKYVRLSIMSLWLYTAVWIGVGFSRLRQNPEACFYPLLVRPEVHIFYSCGSLLDIIGIVCINTHLFIYARRQVKKIAPTLVGMTSEAREVEMARMTVKSIKTTTSVVVPFVLLNTPMYIFYLILGFDNQIGKTVLGLGVTNILSSLVILNSLVNPFVYVWRSHGVRGEIKKMLSAGRLGCRRD